MSTPLAWRKTAFGRPIRRGRWEPPESLARGTRSQGFSRNLGDLPSPPVQSRQGAPDSNGPGPGWVNALARGTNGHSAERYRAVEGDRRRPGRAGRSLTTSEYRRAWGTGESRDPREGR